MNRMVLAFFTSLYLSASAQITVTNATFPGENDELKTIRDITPDLIGGLTAPGTNQVWDFSNLKFGATTTTKYETASNGAQADLFPNAELLIKGQANETYYNVTNSKVELLGYVGNDPAGLGINVTAKFDPPIVIKRAPMHFFDINQIDSDLSLPFSTDDLPDSLLQNLPIGGFVDSIRVRIHIERLDVVDAWGSLKIPGGTYPVLREKRTQYSTTNLDIHLPFLGWQPIGGGTGGGFLDFLGTDTTITYNYVSNTEKEEIAVVRVNNDNSMVESVTFKNNGFTPIKDVFSPGSANIQAYPNPAVEWVRFDCFNLPNSEYTLKIFNIVGKVVWKEVYALAGNKSIRVDLENFKKGTYLYSLSDKKGNIIGTKRLVVVKP